VSTSTTSQWQQTNFDSCRTVNLERITKTLKCYSSVNLKKTFNSDRKLETLHLGYSLRALRSGVTIMFLLISIYITYSDCSSSFSSSFSSSSLSSSSRSLKLITEPWHCTVRWPDVGVGSTSIRPCSWR